MNIIDQLARLDPAAALHEAWHRSSPATVIATGSVGFTGYLASVNWSAALAFVCVALPMLFGTCLQLYRQWKFALVDIEVYQRKLAYAEGHADAVASERVVAAGLVTDQTAAAVTALAVTIAAQRPEGEGAGHP